MESDHKAEHEKLLRVIEEKENEVQKLRSTLEKYDTAPHRSVEDTTKLLEQVEERVMKKLKEVSPQLEMQYQLAILNEEKVEIATKEISNLNAKIREYDHVVKQLAGMVEFAKAEKEKAQQQCFHIHAMAQQQAAQLKEAIDQINQKNIEGAALKKRISDMGTEISDLSTKLQNVLHSEQQAASGSTSSSIASVLTFKNVQELVHVNRELERKVRILENNNKTAQEARENQELINKLMQELGELKEKREKEVEITKQLIQENNMYKTFVETMEKERQENSRHSSRSSSQPPPSPSSASATDNEIFRSEMKKNVEFQQSRNQVLEKENSELKNFRVKLEGEYEILKNRYDSVHKHIV
jgi:DNA repair exonuclease SbcCD ATPase subunit